MVLPDGAPAETERPSPGRRAFFVVAGVALLGGILTLGALTSPDPTAVAPTSTSTTTTTEALRRPVDVENFSVSQIVTGEQLEWTLAETIQGAWPVSVVSHRDRVYAFASTGLTSAGRPTGSTVYSSTDGFEWRRLDSSLPASGFIADVASTPFGLVGLEVDRPDGSLVAWSSPEGLIWTPTQLAADAGVRFGPFGEQSVGSSGDLTVVGATPFVDGAALLSKRLGEFGLEVDLDDSEWTVMPRGEDAVLVLIGPLGFGAAEIPVSELGLTQEERSLIQDPYRQRDTMVWATTNGVHWTQAEVEGLEWVSTLSPAIDGGLLMFGYGNNGNTAWHTNDGVEWERLPFGIRAERTAVWRDMLVGLSNYGIAEVVMSPDGEEWADLGVSDHFPLGIDWYPADLAVHDSGIAVWITGYEMGNMIEPAEPVVLERDGAHLTLDLDSGNIRLDWGSGSRSWHTWARRLQDGVAVDLANRTVTFLDEGESPIVTFTFEELEEAQSDFFAGYPGPERGFDALALSLDGATWTIQDMDTVLGNDAGLVDLHITGSSVLAVVSPSPRAYLNEGDIQIWVAPLP